MCGGETGGKMLISGLNPRGIGPIHLAEARGLMMISEVRHGEKAFAKSGNPLNSRDAKYGTLENQIGCDGL